MVQLLKITGPFILILGLQLNNIEIAFATTDPHNSIKVYNYEPPERGGPESSQAAGTR